jgi:hypothetical protein
MHKKNHVILEDVQYLMLRSATIQNEQYSHSIREIQENRKNPNVQKTKNHLTCEEVQIIDAQKYNHSA